MLKDRPSPVFFFCATAALLERFSFALPASGLLERLFFCATAALLERFVFALSLRYVSAFRLRYRSVI